MAAPKGNQFWKMRSKHGRDAMFASPKLLWEAACEYFEWCESSPIIDPRSFGGKQKIQRPFTMQGLCLYLNCNTKYFHHFAESTKDQDFNNIIQDIKETIYQQKFENAAIGVYKENIIARELGLADKQDVKNDVSVSSVFEIGYDDDGDTEKA